VSPGLPLVTSAEPSKVGDGITDTYPRYIWGARLSAVMQELTLRTLAKLDSGENLAASGLAVADILDSNCLNGSEQGIRHNLLRSFRAIWAAPEESLHHWSLSPGKMDSCARAPIPL